MTEYSDGRTETVSIRQKRLRVKFAKRFAEKPDVEVVARYGPVSKTLTPRVSRGHFDVKLPVSTTLVDRSYSVEWTAHGEIEGAISKALKIVAGVGAVLGLYATIVKLGWIPNVSDLLVMR